MPASPVATFSQLPAGELDRSFGLNSNGRVQTVATDLPESPSNVAAVATGALSDGRIVVLASVNDGAGVRLFRYSPSGVLDSGFSPGANLGSSTALYLAVQPDDKMVVAAKAANGQLVFSRYNTDGSEDTIFNSNADAALVDVDATANLQFQPRLTRCLAVQADGRIVVGGYLSDSSGQITLLRLNGDGTMDSTNFGVAGKVRHDFGNGNRVARSLTVSPVSQRILVVGTVSGVVTQFNTDGSPDDGSINDTTVGDVFGNSGMTVAPGLFSSDLHRLAPTVLVRPASGHIIVVGAAGGVTAVQYTANGSLDTTFGIGGVARQAIVVFSAGQPNAYEGVDQPWGISAVLETTGGILVACKYLDLTYTNDIEGNPYSVDTLARFTPNGLADPAFGENGLKFFNGRFAGDYPNHELIATQDGRVVGAQTASDSQNFSLFGNLAVNRIVSTTNRVAAGQQFSIALGADDADAADKNAGFVYEIDWDGNGTWDQTVSQSAGNGSGEIVTHTYASVAAPTTYEISVRATDQGGNESAVFGSDVVVLPFTAAAIQDAIADSAETHISVANATDFDLIIEAVEGVSQPAVPISVAVTATGVDLTEFNPAIPAGVTLIVNGAIFHGGSPALTLDTGNLIVFDSVFVNTTDAPTIRVTGGHLTIRNSVVQESTAFNRAAIQITAGVVDLGTIASPGFNTINVNGSGVFFENATSTPVSTVGSSFTKDGAPVGASPTANAGGPYTVVRGDAITLDASGSADPDLPNDTLTYEWDFDDDGEYDDAVGINPTFSASGLATGTRTVGLRVTDSFGEWDMATATVEVAVHALLPDPCDPGTTALFVGGTTGNDNIVISPVGNLGTVQVKINGTTIGTFSPSGRVVVYGDAGNDDLQTAGSISRPVWLYGGTGNDRLKGGDGHDVLLGELGNDLLTGGGGRDLMIGGDGADRIVGNADDDVLIADWTVHESSPSALCAIMDEWTRTDRTYLQRIDNLKYGGGHNGSVVLNNSTIFANNDADALTGSSGLDWFIFDDAHDRVTDLHDEVFIGDLEFIGV